MVSAQSFAASIRVCQPSAADLPSPQPSDWCRSRSASHQHIVLLMTKSEARAWAPNPMFFQRASVSMKKTDALAILRRNIDEIQFRLKQDKALADGFVLGRITTKTFVLAADRLHDWRMSMEIMSGGRGCPHLWEE